MKTQNLHRHMVDAIVVALIEIFRDQGYADKVIGKNLKNQRKWGSRDRRFYAEQVYDCVRWWRQYWFLLGEDPSFDSRKVLRLWGIYQLRKGQPLPDWSELQGLSLSAARLDELQRNRVIRESIPDWLDEKGSRELGGRWDSIVHSLNEPAPVDLRVNSLKATVPQVQLELQKEEIITDPVNGVETALSLEGRKNVFITKSFLAGHFEVQDRASQLVAPFLKVEPGLRVIDACAGAGGKSLHIAALMKNKGKLISMDIHEWKLKELRTRATRNGIDIIEVKPIEGSKTIKRLEKTADRVLLDVPCSGLGVLRRNPDYKWKMKPESFADIQKLQAELLREYSQMTKVGGRLVYATCSFFPSENEQQVESFLKEQGDAWKLEDQLRVDPDQGRGDGFFAARLFRKS
jgi:16S rRNA (cytosine967-C5)-methyltransferase